MNIQDLPAELITNNIFDFCSGKAVSTTTHVFVTSRGFKSYDDFSDVTTRRFRAMSDEQALPESCNEWLKDDGWFSHRLYGISNRKFVYQGRAEDRFDHTKCFMRRFSEQALILDFFEDALQGHVLRMEVDDGDGNSNKVKAVEWPLWCGEIGTEQISQTGTRLVHRAQHVILTTPDWDMLKFVQWNTDYAKAASCVRRGRNEQMKRLRPIIQRKLPFGTTGRLRGLTAEDAHILFKIAKMMREQDHCIMRTSSVNCAMHTAPSDHEDQTCADVIFVSRLQVLSRLMHSSIQGSHLARNMLSDRWSLGFHLPPIDSRRRNDGDDIDFVILTPNAQVQTGDDSDDVMVFFDTPDINGFTEGERNRTIPAHFVDALITYLRRQKL